MVIPTPAGLSNDHSAGSLSMAGRPPFIAACARRKGRDGTILEHVWAILAVVLAAP
jgi:hypothetical protein